MFFKVRHLKIPSSAEPCKPIKYHAIQHSRSKTLTLIHKQTEDRLGTLEVLSTHKSVTYLPGLPVHILMLISAAYPCFALIQKHSLMLITVQHFTMVEVRLVLPTRCSWMQAQQENVCCLLKLKIVRVLTESHREYLWMEQRLLMKHLQDCSKGFMILCCIFFKYFGIINH